jgi:mannose/cellobiose epimerase-like protein (N-acyl-D-glucosamine 2-epimerase family)
VTGLWRDKYQPDETFVEEPAPASSFYHIVLSILEMDRAVSAAQS